MVAFRGIPTAGQPGLGTGASPKVERPVSSTSPATARAGRSRNLAAMRFLIERGLGGKAFTYAAPHPGNEDVPAAYDGHIASVCDEYADDIVPLLPPSLVFRHMFAVVPFAKPYVHRLRADHQRPPRRMRRRLHGCRVPAGRLPLMSYSR